MIKKEKKRNVFCTRILLLLLATAFVFGSALGAYALMIPKTVSCFIEGDIPSYLGATFEPTEDSAVESGAVVNLSRGQYKLFGTIPVRTVTLARLEDVKVYAGGVPFGIKFATRGAMVVGFENESANPAYEAGLRLYDTIIRVNGKDFSSVTELSRIAEGGAELEITYLRAGREGKVKFSPKYSENEKKHVLGLWLKDSGAGIGTLTFVLEDGSFGGLGHGICEGNTGELVPMLSGSVLDVTLNGVQRGQKGVPGELKGYFNSSKVGALYKNTEVGVFGALAKIPEQAKAKSYSLGLKNELKEGDATIICTLDDNIRREYKVEISAINRNATGNKCFTIKIIDEKLIEQTGGIVQGMSGSPIIQDGKLVGAVTHVLVGDPTTGYGIFIENMLAQMVARENAA